jgi:DNA-directed RNA polymerase specialized sigma24 family protein
MAKGGDGMDLTAEGPTGSEAAAAVAVAAGEAIAQPGRIGDGGRARERDWNEQVFADGLDWEELVGRFGQGLRCRVRQTLRRSGVAVSPEHLDDLTQEIYCRLLADGSRRLTGCRGRSAGQVGAYLGRLAERVVFDQLRLARAVKRGGRLAIEVGLAGRRGAQQVADPAAGPEERVLLGERCGRVRRCCATLGGQQAVLVVELVLAAGFTTPEIAAALGGGVTPQAVRRLISTVRRRLRRPRRAPAGERTPAGGPSGAGGPSSRRSRH